jgi:hypothetical protein
MSTSTAKRSVGRPRGITLRTQTIQEVKSNQDWLDDPNEDFGEKIRFLTEERPFQKLLRNFVKADNSYQCFYCRSGVNYGSKNYRQHIKGKKHLKKEIDYIFGILSSFSCKICLLDH